MESTMENDVCMVIENVDWENTDSSGIKGSKDFPIWVFYHSILELVPRSINYHSSDW